MSNDLIRRQDALDAINSAIIRISGMVYSGPDIGKIILKEYYKQCRLSIVAAVRDIEPAVPEDVKHGKWIVVGKTPHGANILQCSCCNKIRKGAGKSMYCRDCGAKMDLKEVSV